MGRRDVVRQYERMGELMSEIQSGLCQCGCGEVTSIRSGKPSRYIHGHNGRQMTDAKRFEQYVYPDPNSGCYIFAGSETRGGYGNFYLGGRDVRAHRAAWLLAGRLILDGMYLLHKCDTPCCVNVDHLFLGTQANNLADMARKGRGRRGRDLLPRGIRMRENGKFQANKYIDGRMVSLGTFHTLSEAELAMRIEG